MASRPRLDLEDYLPYLVNRVGVALAVEFGRDALVRRGLSIEMWRVLAVLSSNGEHRQVPLKEIRAVYFVRDFTEDYEPERKAFFSRPKLDGLWVRLKFRDNQTLEGVVSNDLLALLDSGIQITPPDLNGAAVRIFVPRNALSEVTVLGVVGVARRKPVAAALPAQPKLFSE